MFGILLMLSGTFFEELAVSAGKLGVRRHLESPFSFGFISSAMQLVLFATILFFRRGSLDFSWDSLPYLIARILLEMVLASLTLYAITRADRSTFGFIRTLTIPAVLVVDLSVGYAFGWLHVAGIILIVGALLFLFLNHGLRARGAGLSLASALLAAATISLFKYSITNYNSPEIDQSVASAVLLVYFYVMARLVYKENAIRTFLTGRGIFQSSLSAIASLAESYAFLFAPAAVIVAAKRAMSVFWSVLSGRSVFHERHLAVKLIALFTCALGLSLLAF
jgi:hypothetical protein